MIYKPGHLRERSREIINARNWGIGAATGLLGLGLFVSEIQRIRSLQFDALHYAYLGVFVLTGVLIFLWIWATQKELDLLFDWLDPERWVPPSSVKETFLILLIALTLTGLLFGARDPVVYGVLFTFYSAILIPSTIYMNREIREAVEKSCKRLVDEGAVPGTESADALYLSAAGVLESYFLRRPMIPRLYLILVASTLSTCLAALWKSSHDPLLGIAAYAGFFLTILVSEVVIARWRSARDHSLRLINRELVEHLREDASERLPRAAHKRQKS